MLCKNISRSVVLVCGKNKIRTWCCVYTGTYENINDSLFLINQATYLFLLTKTIIFLLVFSSLYINNFALQSWWCCLTLSIDPCSTWSSLSSEPDSLLAYDCRADCFGIHYQGVCKPRRCFMFYLVFPQFWTRQLACLWS